MTLFIKASNQLYVKILQGGTFIPMEVVSKSTTTTGVIVPQRYTPKDFTKYTEADKELIFLDTSLQLILVEITDNNMSHQIMGCNTACEMWNTIEDVNGRH